MTPSTAPVLPVGQSFRLPALPCAPGEARAKVRTLLRSWGIDAQLCDDVVLVASELVTNAIVHTSGHEVGCRLSNAHGVIRIEVEDEGSRHTAPRARPAPPDAQSGRGLVLVASLSADWGAGRSPCGPGGIVWAEFTPGQNQPPLP
jgi:anti-sigma regulatory factor (Ser/Thr protein kinase)